MSESTGSMWLRMLGLEDVWKTANSPDFQAQIAQLFAAIMETRIRTERIEFKLDALLDRMGFDDIKRRPVVTILPPSGSGDGAGAFADASAVAHARSRIAPTQNESDGGYAESLGGSHPFTGLGS